MTTTFMDLLAVSPWACWGALVLLVSTAIVRALPSIIDALTRSRLTRITLERLDWTNRDTAHHVVDLLKSVHEPPAGDAGNRSRPSAVRRSPRRRAGTRRRVSPPAKEDPPEADRSPPESDEPLRLIQNR